MRKTHSVSRGQLGGVGPTTVTRQTRYACGHDASRRVRMGHSLCHRPPPWHHSTTTTTDKTTSAPPALRHPVPPRLSLIRPTSDCRVFCIVTLARFVILLCPRGSRCLRQAPPPHPSLLQHRASPPLLHRIPKRKKKKIHLPSPKCCLALPLVPLPELLRPRTPLLKRRS